MSPLLSEGGYLLFGAAFLLASLAYEPFFISSPWQATPGKRLFGLVVTSLAGERLSFWHAAGRTLAKALFVTVTLGIGAAVALFSQRRQAVHDMVVRTVVVERG